MSDSTRIKLDEFFKDSKQELHDLVYDNKIGLGTGVTENNRKYREVISKSSEFPVSFRQRILKVKAKAKARKSSTIVDKIYYINSPKQFLRKTFMSRQLKVRAGTIPSERFLAAAKPQGPEVEFSNGKMATYLKLWGAKPKRTDQSIYLSHARLLQKIWQDAQNDAIGYDNPVLILEDDIALKENWLDTVQETLKAVPQDWDLVKLGYWGKTNASDTINAHVYRACCHDTPGLHYMGLQAYAVRPSRIWPILNALKHRPLADIDKVLQMSQGPLQQIHVYASSKQIGEHTQLGGSSRPLNEDESSLDIIA